MAQLQQAASTTPSSYYPAPPAYTQAPQQVTPAPGQPPTAVVVQPVIVRQQPAFGPHPMVAMCPEGHQVTTQIFFVNGNFTFLVAAILCLFLGPIAVVVFFVDSLKDVEHRCPIDGTVLGLYKRSL